MIIFYNKQTGDIIGSIFGRIHGAEHQRMWLGDKQTVDRLIVEFTPVRFFDRQGKEVAQDAKDANGHPLAVAADFEPNHVQKELFVALDIDPHKIHDYKMDVIKKQLIPKG